MKFIENQISSAISDIRSRVRGKVSPERAALDAMSKIDATHSKKIQASKDMDNNSGDEIDTSSSDSRQLAGSNEYDIDPSLSVQYKGSHMTRDSGSHSHDESIHNDRYQTGAGHGVIKRVITKSAWDNDLIKAAVPSLLTILPIISNKVDIDDGDIMSLNLQLTKHIEDFRTTLLSSQYLSEDVDNMGAMLCTFLDEKLAEHGIVFDKSLLVHFYKDAWGGEKCFEHLDNYLEKPNKNKKILEFYDLFLSLGFLGKYGIIDQGPIILNNLKSEIKGLLFTKPTIDLTHLLDYEILKRRNSLITPLKLLIGTILTFVMLYLLISFYLHSLSRDLRNEINAWEPPVLATIRTTPPPELASILKEGWLQIREHPLGWLLIFTSDGAFNVGSAELTEEFKEKKNLERLGNALANYPGDLVVIGHTDNTRYKKGTGSNLQLSIDRARTVERELRNGTSINNYNQRKISSEGKGDSEPIFNNDTKEGRAKNRRVDILWKIGRKEKDEFLEILDNGDKDIIKDQVGY
ncbi:MAG: OmpA family protein [Neisseriaceae bacterium]|nr:MAG: OmpA family protein [Neisseriaceae bacterium]